MRYYNDGMSYDKINKYEPEWAEEMLEHKDESLFAWEDHYGVRHYYNDQWEKIEDSHYEECPVSIAAKGKKISTLCVCRMIEEAREDI